ncbi:hypothetical protein T484DRAFT_1787668 [Baffinella frigidus]|nr:hypothetical protein T484DRAFT_1787668 [Cryptophyta sp. CCMP2293]
MRESEQLVGVTPSLQGKKATSAHKLRKCGKRRTHLHSRHVTPSNAAPPEAAGRSGRGGVQVLFGGEVWTGKMGVDTRCCGLVEGAPRPKDTLSPSFVLQIHSDAGQHLPEAPGEYATLDLTSRKTLGEYATLDLTSRKTLVKTAQRIAFQDETGSPLLLTPRSVWLMQPPEACRAGIEAAFSNATPVPATLLLRPAGSVQ